MRTSFRQKNYTRWPTRVDGRFVTEGGESTGGKHFLIKYDTPGHIEDSYSLFSKKDGSYLVEGLPPGPATVEVWDFGLARALAGSQLEQGVNLGDFFPRQAIEIAESGITQIEVVLPTLP